jgi:4-cresol dehydrogenase (hydroxylating)
MNPVYPPGLTPAAFARALKALERVVGAEAVFATAEDRDTYADKFAIDDSRHHALAGLAPISAAQVQAIVRIANEFRIPLWPISRGKNLGYGYAAPELAGSVVVDLGRMKKIEIDVENGVATLEPGVGFYDLYDYLQQKKIPLWLSVPGNSWGSVIGNALDRGIGYTPYGENTSKLCGLEVVLPDGDLVRTGMGAAAGAPTWGLYRYGFGPAWDQMFVQSNFGIVTKANIWLMTEPEQVRGMDVEMEAIEDLAPLIDTIGALRREGVLQQSPTIGNWLRAANIVSTRSDWIKDGAPLTDDVITAIRKKFGLGWWGVSLRLYGRSAVTDATYPILEHAMRAIKPLVKVAGWACR